MSHQLAQLNIAKFKVKADHPDNQEFFDNIDSVNSLAESSPGFVWRFEGDGGWAFKTDKNDDASYVVNLSVWSEVQSLWDFVYLNEGHRTIMGQRKKWFERLDASHQVLWWIYENEFPTIEQARKKLFILQNEGAGPKAFTFKRIFSTTGIELT